MGIACKAARSDATGEARSAEYSEAQWTYTPNGNCQGATYTLRRSPRTATLGSSDARIAELNGKSLAFCAKQGELHATNAGTRTCRLDRNEAGCRSVAGESAEREAAAFRSSIQVPLKPRVTFPGYPSNACVRPREGFKASRIARNDPLSDPSFTGNRSSFAEYRVRICRNALKIPPSKET